MPQPDDQLRYSSAAILLHWLVALALAFQLALGVGMPKDESGFALYQLHKSVGIAILALTVLRLGVRLMHKAPPVKEAGVGGQVARAVHMAFYFLLILIPLTGWALVSTAEIKVPTILFGIVELPHLPLSTNNFGTIELSHTWLSWLVIVLILLHAAGALRHQLILRDHLFQRIAPRRSAITVWAAAALVLAVGAGFPIAAKLSNSWDREENAGDGGMAEVVSVEENEFTGNAEEIIEAANQGTLTKSMTDWQQTGKLELASENPRIAEPAPTPSTWIIQPGGRLSFSVRNGEERIQGSFATWSGTIVFDPDRPESADLRIRVNLASASVGDATIDGVLRGAEYLAADAFPTAHWQSKSVAAVGEGRYRAEGTLELKGASHSQQVVFSLSGNRQRQTVRGSATIDRGVFGIGTGLSADNLADSVSLEFSFDATSSP